MLRKPIHVAGEREPFERSFLWWRLSVGLRPSAILSLTRIKPQLQASSVLNFDDAPACPVGNAAVELLIQIHVRAAIGAFGKIISYE